jgi:hypothetical protein
MTTPVKAWLLSGGAREETERIRIELSFVGNTDRYGTPPPRSRARSKTVACRAAYRCRRRPHTARPAEGSRSPSGRAGSRWAHSSGKTTLAARLRDAVTGSSVVHTDDIAWQHSRFGWADLLIDGILIPTRGGYKVTFRPPRWEEHQRAGAIEVPTGRALVIIEGVGAARRESAHLIDAAVWVQSDEREIERRSRARVGKPGNAPTIQDWCDWMAEEVPFLADQRPWEHADLVACGTPQILFEPTTELVVAQPPGRDRRTGRPLLASVEGEITGSDCWAPRNP